MSPGYGEPGVTRAEYEIGQYFRDKGVEIFPYENNDIIRLSFFPTEDLDEMLSFNIPLDSTPDQAYDEYLKFMKKYPEFTL